MFCDQSFECFETRRWKCSRIGEREIDALEVEISLVFGIRYTLRHDDDLQPDAFFSPVSPLNVLSRRVQCRFREIDGTDSGFRIAPTDHANRPRNGDGGLSMGSLVRVESYKLYRRQRNTPYSYLPASRGKGI